MYYQYNDLNNDSVDLDKMARDINDAHKRKSYNEAKQQCQTQNNNLLSGIDYLADNNKFNFSYINNNSDFSSSLPTPMEEESASIDSSFSFADISTASSYSSLTPKQKKRFKSDNKHLSKFNGNDKNSIIHLKECEQCRDKLLKILKDDNIIQPNKINEANILNLSTPELKDILIIMLGGVILIIILDSIFRK